jgi:hypothetical protein
MQNRTDPYAGDRALAAALQDPPSGPSPDEAVAEVRDVLDPIGDTCPGVSVQRLTIASE